MPIHSFEDGNELRIRISCVLAARAGRHRSRSGECDSLRMTDADHVRLLAVIDEAAAEWTRLVQSS